MIIFLGGRIILKYGTNALISYDDAGFVRINKERLGGIAYIVHSLYKRESEPILVTSGAVAAGMELNRMSARPSSEEEAKDLAAEGQPYLISEYRKALNAYNIGVYQLLVTLKTVRRKIVRRRIESALMRGKIAIINTDDALSEKLIDNDPIAAALAVYCNASSLIMISEAGNLGSGGASSKEKALRMAKKQGIKTAVMTHAELDELIRKWQR